LATGLVPVVYWVPGPFPGPTPRPAGCARQALPARFGAMPSPGAAGCGRPRHGIARTWSSCRSGRRARCRT